MIIRANNWRELQHYSKRRPTWIKLHRKLLDNRVFLQLPDASRALAPMLWLLCSEGQDGAINDAMSEITFRLHMSEQAVSKALAPLLAAGFFVREPDAIDPLARGKPNGVSEGEREGKPLQGFPLSEGEIPHPPSPVAAHGRLEGAAHDSTTLIAKLTAGKSVR